MAELVYALCAFLSVAVGWFLYRGYRTSRSKLLLWSCLAFAIFAINNVILFADLVVFPAEDFGGGLLRNVSGALAGSLLLFGLIWEVS